MERQHVHGVNYANVNNTNTQMINLNSAIAAIVILSSAHALAAVTVEIGAKTYYSHLEVEYQSSDFLDNQVVERNWAYNTTPYVFVDQQFLSGAVPYTEGLQTLKTIYSYSPGQCNPPCNVEVLANGTTRTSASDRDYQFLGRVSNAVAEVANFTGVSIDGTDSELSHTATALHRIRASGDSGSYYDVTVKVQAIEVDNDAVDAENYDCEGWAYQWNGSYSGTKINGASIKVNGNSCTQDQTYSWIGYYTFHILADGNWHDLSVTTTTVNESVEHYHYYVIFHSIDH